MDTSNLSSAKSGRKYHEVSVIRAFVKNWMVGYLSSQYFVGRPHNWIIGLDRPL
jgi:hypothetical protein